MVTTERSIDAVFWRLVIEPNCSLTWRQSMAFLLGTSALSLSIALVFALKGYWMIFPFAGLELAALAVCFYLVASSARRRQVVSISTSRVTVEKGKVRRSEADGGPDSCDEFPRCWTRVEVVEGRPYQDPTRLFIGAFGRRVELGEFLAEGEKRGLAKYLRDLIRGADGDPPGPEPASDDMRT